MCDFHAEGISETYKTSQEQQQPKFVSHAFCTTQTCKLRHRLTLVEVDASPCRSGHYVYTAHSTRAVSTLVPNDSGASINLIMKAAGWTNVSMFAQFYMKHTEEKPTLGQVVLERFLTKH